MKFAVACLLGLASAGRLNCRTNGKIDYTKCPDGETRVNPNPKKGFLQSMEEWHPSKEEFCAAMSEISQGEMSPAQCMTGANCAGNWDKAQICIAAGNAAGATGGEEAGWEAGLTCLHHTEWNESCNAGLFGRINCRTNGKLDYTKCPDGETRVNPNPKRTMLGRINCRTNGKLDYTKCPDGETRVNPNPKKGFLQILDHPTPQQFCDVISQVTDMSAADCVAGSKCGNNWNLAMKCYDMADDMDGTDDQKMQAGLECLGQQNWDECTMFGKKSKGLQMFQEGGWNPSQEEFCHVMSLASQGDIKETECDANIGCGGNWDTAQNCINIGNAAGATGGEEAGWKAGMTCIYTSQWNECASNLFGKKPRKGGRKFF